MSVAHKDIIEAHLHESKGVSTAAASRIYVADGLGSGVWQQVDPEVSLSSTGETMGKVLTADGANGVSYGGNGVWNDSLGRIIVRGTGANDPAWELITGATSLWGYSFAAATMMQFWTTFHIGHDYKPGTAVYAHIHWFNAAAVPNTGNVRWGFEYAVAKGHSQQAFPMTATTTVYKTQASSATRYMHQITEMDLADAIPSTSIEPDSLIHVRFFRDAADVGDTCTDKVYALMADCHYQADSFGTKNKVPNFYT